MDYRPLTADDAEAYLALEGYAFRSNPDRSGLSGERLAAFRGLFVDGALAAQLELIPLQIQSGLGPVAASGIGSVASAPELRRRGHSAALLGRAAAELRAAGASLCILFPFKRSFYARYGWATFVERRLYSGPPALFAPFRHGPGRFSPAGPADIPELDALYQAALRGRFGPLVRDEAHWRDEVLSDWERRRYYAYIYRGEDGRGRAYLVYRFEGAGDHREGQMLIREIAALDPEARAQLFAFIADHDSQVTEVRFRAPADAPVAALFPDPPACQVEPHFMLRILDVAGALAALPYPRDLAGRLTFAVRDGWMPENSGVYALEVAGGRGEVARLPAEAPAEISLEIGPLAQLISRYLRPRTAAAFGLIRAERAALELAERAFAGLAPFCSDFF